MGTTPLFRLESSDADRQRVENALRDSVKTSDAYLTDLASHLLLAGGKRLRPMFSVVASQIAGAPTTEEAVFGGISCELVHLGNDFPRIILPSPLAIGAVGLLSRRNRRCDPVPHLRCRLWSWLGVLWGRLVVVVNLDPLLS